MLTYHYTMFSVMRVVIHEVRNISNKYDTLLQIVNKYFELFKDRYQLVYRFLKTDKL